MDDGPTSEQLMAEMAWVRRLARALVRDEAVADDVAQDAWLIANEREPSVDRPLRPWLARVVINLIRTRRRADLRRGAREIASDDPRLVYTPAELVERVELQRTIADEVLALDEPYRSTVLLHFFEGVSSTDLAERLGIPAGTVRRRLKVALDQLREALRRRTDQPKRGWIAALVPLAQPLPTHPVIGVIAMKKLIAIVALILALLAGGFLWKHHRDTTRTSTSSTTAKLGSVWTPQRTDAPHTIPSWLVQTDVAPRRIAGRVVTAGSPVAGAIVKLAVRLDGELLQPIAEATSTADGAFDFGAQPAAVFVVSAAAPKHAPVALAVALADPKANADHLVIELADCRARMFGLVTDAGGGAIANARLTTAGLGGVVSDATGHYSACIAPINAPGTAAARVRVEADGYGTIEEQVIVVGELHHDFVLAPEAVLVGRVTAGEQPVEGARVIATPDPVERPNHVAGNWAESDHDGRFRIVGLAPGKFRLAASAENLGTNVPVLVIARPAATSHDIHLSLVAFARMRGHVVAAGAPIAGAAVAVSDHGQPSGASSISQADGSFVLDHVPYGTTNLVAPPYQVKTPTTIAVMTTSIDGIELAVRKLASIHGHVTRKGKPVANAGVMCGPPPGHETTADAMGAYVVEGLSGGVVECSGWDPTDRAFTLAPAIQLSASEDKALDLDLDCSGRAKGSVVDQSGTAVGGAYVRLDLVNNGNDSCEALSDPSGAFDCGALSGGEYAISVTPSPGARQPFAPAAGGHFASVQVTKDAITTGIVLAIKNDRLSIRGAVVDDTGAALADVTVRALGRGRSGMSLPSALTDADGHFQIDDLAPGSYNLDARAADDGEIEVIGIASGTSGVTITLPRPGAIDGTLVGFSTPPAVVTTTLTNDLLIGGVAIVDGTTFTVSGLTPGRYTIQAQLGAEIDGASVDVHSGETAHVTLTNRGRGTIEGTVSELGAGTPLAGSLCDTRLSLGGQMSVASIDPSRLITTDASGRFRMDAPTGRVRVICFSPGTTLSIAGTDVDVGATAGPGLALFSVRPTFDATPADVGFTLRPILLPITVNQIDPKGPAAASGVVSGDHLVTIDGQSLQGLLPQGASYLLQNHRPGTSVVLGIERAGATRTITIAVGD